MLKTYAARQKYSKLSLSSGVAHHPPASFPPADRVVAVDTPTVDLLLVQHLDRVRRLVRVGEPRLEGVVDCVQHGLWNGFDNVYGVSGLGHLVFESIRWCQRVCRTFG